MGGGRAAGGGGGQAGEIDWPGYLEGTHGNWLMGDSGSYQSDGIDPDEQNMQFAIGDAWDNSPYAHLSVYDPSNDVAIMEQYLNIFSDVVDAMAHQTDFESNIDKAIELAGDVYDTDSLNNLVDEYEEKQLDAYLRSVGRFSAGMGDIGSINTSSYVVSMAMMERGHQRDVAQFRSQLLAEQQRDKERFIESAATQMSRLYMQYIDNVKAKALLAVELRRITIAAKTDSVREQADHDVKDATWNLEIWQYGANLLAAASGGVASPAPQLDTKQGSPVGGGLSGALSGAATGAAIGAPFGGFGAIPGSVIGAALGGVGGGAAGALLTD